MKVQRTWINFCAVKLSEYTCQLSFVLVLISLISIEASPNEKNEIALNEPYGVELSVEVPEKFALEKDEVIKIFEEYFTANNLPVKDKSRLKINLKISPPILIKVSKLADLVRAEIKVEVQLLLPKTKKPYYTFSILCKGLEDGNVNALNHALTSMRMDDRELDLLAEKLGELAGEGFY